MDITRVSQGTRFHFKKRGLIPFSNRKIAGEQWWERQTLISNKGIQNKFITLFRAPTILTQHTERLGFLNGLRLTLRFLFCKFLYAFMMMFQIVIVVNFGGAGFGLLDKIHYASKLNPSSKLPTMLICRLKMDTEPKASYLCALPGNKLFQLLFGFLFYWMVFVFLCNLFSFISWILRMCPPDPENHTHKELSVQDGCSEVLCTWREEGSHQVCSGVLEGGWGTYCEVDWVLHWLFHHVQSGEWTVVKVQAGELCGFWANQCWWWTGCLDFLGQNASAFFKFSSGDETIGNNIQNVSAFFKLWRWTGDSYRIQTFADDELDV